MKWIKITASIKAEDITNPKDDYKTFRISGFNLSLGNNYTIGHFWKAVANNQEVRSFLQDFLENKDVSYDDVIEFVYSGSYSHIVGLHKDVFAIADIPTNWDEFIEEDDITYED